MSEINYEVEVKRMFPDAYCQKEVSYRGYVIRKSYNIPCLNKVVGKTAKAAWRNAYENIKSQTAQDVMEAIESEYPTDEFDGSGYSSVFNARQFELRAAMLKGYKQCLEDIGSDAIVFSEWCADNNKYVRVTNEQGKDTWIDQDTPMTENFGDYKRYTTEQLYQLFTDSKQVKPLPPSPTK